MPGTHQKTVTVVPVDDAYGWSVIDDATNSTATWITDGNTIGPVQQGSTDIWDFTVQDNTSAAARSATCTVLHSNGVVTDFFTIDQAGTGSAPSTPAGSYNTLTGAPDPVDEGTSVTFTVTGSNLQTADVNYTLTGNGISAGDVGIGMNGTITMTGGVNNTGSLTVPISADNLTEGNETLTCTIASTDSNGISTGNLSTSVTINDTSTTPTIPVTMSFTNAINILGNPALAQWNISGIVKTSGTIYNAVIGMSGDIANADFDAVDGEVVQFRLTLDRQAGFAFTQVGSDPVASLFGQSTGVSKISEDITTGIGFPNIMTVDVEYTVPSSSTSVNQMMNATTLAETTTRLIALFGPLGSTYTCGTLQTPDVTASYDDTLGTISSPRPAVGDALLGVSQGTQDDYLIVTGSGGTATTGTATDLIGQIVTVDNEQITGFSSCTVTGSPTPGMGPGNYSPGPGTPGGSPTPNSIPSPGTPGSPYSPGNIPTPNPTN